MRHDIESATGGSSSCAEVSDQQAPGICGDPCCQRSLPQHPDQYRPERPVLLTVDQELGEGAAFRVAPELADPIDAVEVREAKDVDELGASRRREGFEPPAEGMLHLNEGHGTNAGTTG